MGRIIVEGPDGAGKTRLVTKLVDMFDFPLVVNVKGAEQHFEWWWPETLMMHMGQPVTPIHDRFFYSELVYGPVIRGYLKANTDLIRRMVEVLRNEALLIYARPSREALLEGVRVEAQMEGVLPKQTELIEAYDDLMASEVRYYGKRFYSYDWQNQGEPRSVVEHVKRYLRGELV